MHLRDADLLRDLRLRQSFEEAEVQDPAFALVEHSEAGCEHGAILGYLVLVLLGADRFERVELLAVVRVAPRQRAHKRHVLLDQLLAGLEVALLVVTPQENFVRFAHATRFVNSTHSDPPLSLISTLSHTACRMRARFRASAPPRSSSLRSEANGPTIVRSSPSSTRTRSVRSGSVVLRSSRASSASSKSSRFSNVRSSRTASPPSTRWATRWNASSAGSVNEISSPLNVSLQSDPVGRTKKRRAEFRG